ncbi:3-hydroxyisobutyryl-CoA hydrolase [Microbacterium gorillae]|uniref:3-hydroxyisobutyryl-CoA hydrolase n=1 Tax=Microbacterium gorillae TaxID=1231063 RepID=UPI0006943C14|nr:3-hydroxyisobutyryl-CoA hydrolase [Microbacterium gorillae]
MERQLDDPRVLSEVHGRVGHIRLNRPEALNALEFGMITAITDTLDRWREDDEVCAILLSGAGDRALCAGGDIRASQDPDSPFTSEQFLRTEYALNLAIATYPKPYVAIMHGLVLGGGMGLSAHGSHRIVTHGSRLGMPEVGIGFIPDVGLTHVLSRLAGETGTHLALTGSLVGPGDAILLGLADDFVPRECLPSLIADLETGGPEASIARYTAPAPTAALAGAQAWIDECYVGDDVEAIIRRLSAHPAPAAREAAATILTHSPTALTLALRALREARDDSSLEQSLDREFRVAVRAFASAELAEGVRAQLLDRDRSPRWNPSSLRLVGPDIVAPYFAPVQPPLQLQRRRTV